jgi:hypothetical protein
VPVVVGGYTRAAYRRTAEQAQGFYGYGLSPADARQVVSQLARYARPAELGELEITIASPGPLERDSIRAYEEAGVHRLVLRAPEDGDFAALYSGVT